MVLAGVELRQQGLAERRMSFNSSNDDCADGSVDGFEPSFGDARELAAAFRSGDPQGEVADGSMFDVVAHRRKQSGQRLGPEQGTTLSPQLLHQR